MGTSKELHQRTFFQQATPQFWIQKVRTQTIFENQMYFEKAPQVKLREKPIWAMNKLDKNTFWAKVFDFEFMNFRIDTTID